MNRVQSIDTESKTRWLWREVIIGGLVVGLLVSLGSFAVQWHFQQQDSERAAREEERRIVQSERLENLRFVRERSIIGTQGEPLPFAGLDLHGQPLQGLYMDKAFFAGADLSSSFLNAAHLRGAYLGNTDLRKAWMSGTDVRDAIFFYADLRGVNFTEAKLAGAKLDTACWDLTTVWPTDAVPAKQEQGGDECAQRRKDYLKDLGDP